MEVDIFPPSTLTHQERELSNYSPETAYSNVMVVTQTPLSSALGVKIAGDDRALRLHLRRNQRLARSESLFPFLPHSTNGRLICRKSVAYKGSLRVCSSLVEVEDEACELVNGTEILIGEEDKECVRAFLYTAVKNNNGTGILLLSDIFGFEDSNTRDFAYRVACNGYNVLVPDLFRGDPWQKEWPKSKFEEWIAGHDQVTVAKDISTCIKWMTDELKAAEISRKLGVIGFCYGGGRVIDLLARDHIKEELGMGVCFYGTRMNTELGKQVKSPILFVSGDSDPLCPVEVLYEIEKNINNAGGKSKVVVFPGRGHGFAHRPESPEDDRDAEEAFLIMRSWLHDGLVAVS